MVYYKHEKDFVNSISRKKSIFPDPEQKNNGKKTRLKKCRKRGRLSHQKEKDNAMGKITVKFIMEEGCEDLRPAKAHEDDAAYDLRARTDVTLAPGKVTLVPTGLHIELPPGYEAQVRPRSGLALKHAVGVLNSPGTIDAGYRGEVCSILFNFGETPFEIRRGDRISQMVIAALPDVELVPAEALSETGRGSGGFGSTGRK